MVLKKKLWVVSAFNKPSTPNNSLTIETSQIETPIGFRIKMEKRRVKLTLFCISRVNEATIVQYENFESRLIQPDNQSH